MLLNFEVDVLESELADSSHKKMLKLQHGLLVVLQDLQMPIEISAVEVTGNQKKELLQYLAKVPQLPEGNYQIDLEFVMVIYTRTFLT